MTPQQWITVYAVLGLALALAALTVLALVVVLTRGFEDKNGRPVNESREP